LLFVRGFPVLGFEWTGREDVVVVADVVVLAVYCDVTIWTTAVSRVSTAVALAAAIDSHRTSVVKARHPILGAVVLGKRRAVIFAMSPAAACRRLVLASREAARRWRSLGALQKLSFQFCQEILCTVWYRKVGTWRVCTGSVLFSFLVCYYFILARYML